jgi:hAT family C-terminal dimerisation region
VNRTAASSTGRGPRYAVEAELARHLNKAAECETPSAVEYWQERQKSYLMIGPLALDIVSCPASQASWHIRIERVFSLCGDLSARKRNRATISLERRVFLKLNSKSFNAQLAVVL